MARPKKIIKTKFLHVGIPEPVLAQVNLRLYSTVEGRVPQGAYQTLLTELLTNWLREKGVDTDTLEGASE